MQPRAHRRATAVLLLLHLPSQSHPQPRNSASPPLGSHSHPQLLLSATTPCSTEGAEGDTPVLHPPPLILGFAPPLCAGAEPHCIPHSRTGFCPTAVRVDGMVSVGPFSSSLERESQSSFASTSCKGFFFLCLAPNVDDFSICGGVNCPPPPSPPPDLSQRGAGTCGTRGGPGCCARRPPQTPRSAPCDSNSDACGPFLSLLQTELQICSRPPTLFSFWLYPKPPTNSWGREQGAMHRAAWPGSFSLLAGSGSRAAHASQLCADREGFCPPGLQRDAAVPRSPLCCCWFGGRGLLGALGLAAPSCSPHAHPGSLVSLTPDYTLQALYCCRRPGNVSSPQQP